jgi:SAM-dependent methyltransferase
MAKQSKESSVKLLTNDLIFKELIKRGYSLEGNTRVWNIADSKLWYLTQEQIKFEEGLDKEEKFKKDNEEEVELIIENLNNLKIDLHNEPFNFVDLGVSGEKIVKIIEKVKEFNTPFYYCPLDINPLMIEKARAIFEKNFGEDKLVRFKPVLGDFENLSMPLDKLKEGYKRNVLFMSRSTFVNFDPNEILYYLKNSMDKKDVLILTASLYSPSWVERVKGYRPGGNLDIWIFKTLSAIGISKDEVQFSGRFNNNRSEIVYSFVKPKTIKYEDKEIEFRKGDKIIPLVSYKHQDSDLLTYLHIHFSSVNSANSKSKIYKVAFCKI